MNNNYDSYLDVAYSLMKKKKKPQSLDAITKEVFLKKGVIGSENQIAQFQVDFMLSGLFVYCGEDKDGVQLWDLKNRQNSSFLDKDGGYLKDLTDEDEEVVNNELKEEYHLSNEDNIDQYIEDDEEDSNEQDDIEEDLGLVLDQQKGEDSDETIANYDDEEDDEEELDDIEEALKNRK